MHRTLIIRREYLHFVPKYARYEKRHKNLAAHVSPAFRVEEGDQVTVGQCRPLSKTVQPPGLGFQSYAANHGAIGTIQCVAGATKDRKGSERIPEILRVVETIMAELGFY